MKFKTMRKYEGKIEDNYNEYLKSPLMIGFKSNFPTKQVLAEYTIKDVCRGFQVEFNVRYCICTFGDGKYECKKIETDRVSVSAKLGIRSFGSYCHIDEAEVMRRGIISVCKELDLMICDEITSWPNSEAVVSENFYKN